MARVVLKRNGNWRKNSGLEVPAISKAYIPPFPIYPPSHVFEQNVPVTKHR